MERAILLFVVTQVVLSGLFWEELGGEVRELLRRVGSWVDEEARLTASKARALDSLAQLRDAQRQRLEEGPPRARLHPSRPRPLPPRSARR